MRTVIVTKKSESYVSEIDGEIATRNRIHFVSTTLMSHAVRSGSESMQQIHPHSAHLGRHRIAVTWRLTSLRRRLAASRRTTSTGSRRVFLLVAWFASFLRLWRNGRMPIAGVMTLSSPCSTGLTMRASASDLRERFHHSHSRRPSRGVCRKK